MNEASSDGSIIVYHSRFDKDFDEYFHNNPENLFGLILTLLLVALALYLLSPDRRK